MNISRVCSNRKPAVYESTNQIFSFLPAKAGVGASTIAVNVSGALACRSDTRVLLSDFDLSSGMLRFVLKLTNEFAVADAFERAADMDENLWPQLVTAIHGMDVLHAGPHYWSLAGQPSGGIHAPHVPGIMLRSFRNLEKYSLELMRESKRIVLVCTCEITSLHLAREKLAFLKEKA